MKNLNLIEETKKQINQLEDVLKEAFYKEFNDNVKLQKILNQVENFENYDYIVTGQCSNEVEYQYDISDLLKEIDIKGHEFLDEYMTDACYGYLDLKNKMITQTDGECNFIYTDSDKIYTCDSEEFDYYNDLQAFITIELAREKSGVFGGIYKADRYGTCEIFKTDETMKDIMRYSKKDKIEKLEQLVEYFNGYWYSLYLTIDKSIEDLFIEEGQLYDFHLATNGAKMTITFQVDIDNIEDYTDQYLKDLNKFGVTWEKINDDTCRMVIKKEIDFTE